MFSPCDLLHKRTMTKTKTKTHTFSCVFGVSNVDASLTELIKILSRWNGIVNMVAFIVRLGQIYTTDWYSCLLRIDSLHKITIRWQKNRNKFIYHIGIINLRLLRDSCLLNCRCDSMIDECLLVLIDINRDRYQI